MRKPLFILLFLASPLLIFQKPFSYHSQVNFFELTFQQCINSSPFTMSSVDRCTGQYAFDSSQSYFPVQWRGSSSTKTFSFDLQVEILGACPTPSDINIFSIMISPMSLGPTALIYFYAAAWTVGGNSGVSFLVDFQDINSPDNLLNYQGKYDININTEVEFLASLDLTEGNPHITGYLAYREAVLGISKPGVMVTSDWQFDSLTEIFICSSSLDGSPNYYCSIKSFNYWFTFSPQYSLYTGQLIPALLASYLFGEGSGYQISDSESLGSAYLGGSNSAYAPSWLSTEVGIEFTSATQFVNIKPFRLVSQSPQYDLGSFTVSFWIRYIPGPGTGGSIFQYTNTDLSYRYFTIQIDDSGATAVTINTEVAAFTSTLITSGDWTLLAVTFELHPIGTKNLVKIYIGGSLDVQFLTSVVPIFAYNSQNKVRIGAPNSFKGSIYDFRIYSPGSGPVIHKSTCPYSTTKCLLSLGDLTSNQCLTKPAVTCHSSCKTCFDKTAQACLSCYTDYHISYTQCVSDFPETPPALNPTTTETMKGSQKAAQAATQAVNAVTAGSPSGVSAAIGGKIFSNIKFLNITYAENLEEALMSWGSSFISLGLTPDLPASVTSQIPNEKVNYVFQKRDIPSSFLRNFWESLGMLLFVSFIFSGFFTLEWLVKLFNYKYLPRHLLFAIRAVIQNFLLAQLYSVFGDMFFFACIEFRSPNTHHKWSRLSLASGIILTIIMVIILGYHVHLLMKYQQIRKNNSDGLTQFENENKGSGVLFCDFKDVSTVRQSFLLFLTGRDLLFSLLLTLMFEHPLIECVFILVLNIAMVTYLLLLPPFKSLFDATQQLFYEVVTLSVNVSVLILAIMDNIDSPDDPGLRSKIGRFVIVVNMVFNFGSLAFMLVKAFLTIYQVYKTYKARKHQEKLEEETSDLLVQPKANLPQQETHSNNLIEPIQSEMDQSTLKPFDVSNETFRVNPETPPKISTPKFETFQYSFDENNELDPVQRGNLHKSSAETLEASSLDDDRVRALKAILEKNSVIRKEKEFQTKLSEAALRTKIAREISSKKK